MHVLLANLADDRLRRGIGAVRNDSDHIGGKLPFRRHQNRGSSHRDAGQKNRCVGTEALTGVFHPAQAVQPFPNAEGDGGSSAFSVGTLVYYEGILSGLPRQLVAAIKIPQGGAPVAVKLNLKRRAVPNMVVPGCQLCPILSGDGHSFKRNLIHLPNKRQHSLPLFFVLRTLRDGITIFRTLFRGIERSPVGISGNQNRQKKQSGTEIHDRHITPSPCCPSSFGKAP